MQVIFKGALSEDEIMDELDTRDAEHREKKKKRKSRDASRYYSLSLLTTTWRFRTSSRNVAMICCLCCEGAPRKRVRR